jgi:hypothetical protein
MVPLRRRRGWYTPPVAGEPQQPVPLGDLEIAQRIAGAARSGARADREPTLEQLLGAFGEPEPSPEARTRIASALTLAGLRAQPAVHEAHPGERLKLSAPGGGGRGRALLGAGVIALVIAAAAVIATVSGSGGGKNDRASDALPATTQQTTATAPTTTTTATTPATTPAKPAQTKKRKKKKAEPAVPRKVIVKLVPGPQASYLCVDHGPGTPETETTLSAPLTFKGKRVRINVGLSSVNVTVNGKPFALQGSPTGYDIGIKKRAYLPQGQRPCA